MYRTTSGARGPALWPFQSSRPSEEWSLIRKLAYKTNILSSKIKYNSRFATQRFPVS
jgi:hypothetical protein